MKPVPPGFMDWLINAQQVLIAELYTFRLNNGIEMYFNNVDFDLSYNDKVWRANSVRFDNMKYHNEVGVRVDEMEIKAAAFADDLVNGNNFFIACQQGLFDGAQFTRQRAFWAVDDGRPWVDYQAAPQGVVTLFTGYISMIDKIGRTSAEIKVKSPLKFLDMEMPRNTFQAVCNWTLYDAGCTILRSAHTANFTVAAATRGTITVASISGPTGPDGAPSYQQGRLLFTSGTNNGLQTMMASNDSNTFYLQYPLVNIPAAGDTFAASWGCLKTTNACLNKFNNIANFRGFPKVPPVHVSL